jgi:hypothetical protein
MKSKTSRPKKKPDRLFKVVDKVLKQVFGEPATLFIYKYLEEKYSLKREDIPDQPGIFAEGLEKYLSDSGASLVIGMILGQGSELKPRTPDHLDFFEHLKELKRVSYE